ncbi:MAG: hypothetical protein V4484_16730 [Pseudomonadota bacterium]
MSAAVLSVLLSSAGCRAEMSDARRDHVLAGDHGWIDLTLKAAPSAPDFDPKKICSVSFWSGDESLLGEGADLSRAAQNANPIGYRFAVPSGKLQAEVRLEGCVTKPLVLPLPLDLAKDHLARLVFDGGKVLLESTAPYEPTSLDWVRGEILKLHSSNEASVAAVSRLTTLTIASLTLNLLALLAFLVLRLRVRK